MINIFKKQNDMTIIGQGGKIILFTLPSLITAILVHIYFPQFVALRAGLSFIQPVGYLLLLPGLILWGAAIFLYAGVMIFIGHEEQQLIQAFGKEYEDYLVRVDRMVPFKKP